MQDTVTYSHPCKRYAGKRFLLDTWEQIYHKYLQQTQFHTHGIMSKTTLRCYKPKYILLSGCTPLNQCLCDYCENCELLRRALVAVGVIGIPSNKYTSVESTLCDLRMGQFGTDYEFCMHKCISRQCEHCGKDKLGDVIRRMNENLLTTNRSLTWHRWKSIEGRAPQKCPIKGTLRAAVNEFLEIVEKISEHLFRANWHRNIFQYIKNRITSGYVLQVMDFAMNFNNRYQDEVQSAFWGGTQTTIHGTINFFRCLTEGCNEVVTLSLVHITDDTHHDSFLVRAVQNLTFRYLVEIGVPLDLIIQFCDNCSSQYKSRRPFAELARLALEIIRVYFGEKHGKSHADALFGRLKAWMSYKIKARHFVVTDAYDFYKYCREFYQTPTPAPGCCQHYRVEFQFIRPSDVRRHQDCDLDRRVEHTQDYYSVRNTDQPLQLKVRKVPCLCPPCIEDDGRECLNAEYTDPWKTVNLIPKKGSNKRTYEKRKRPDAGIRDAREAGVDQENENLGESSNAQNENAIESSDDELPDIIFEDEKLNRLREKMKNRKRQEKPVTDRVTDQARSSDHVTDRVTDHTTQHATGIETERNKNMERKCSWINIDEEESNEETCPESRHSQESNSSDIEIIGIYERGSKEFQMAGENTFPVAKEKISVEELIKNNVPESVIWYSIITAMEKCTTFPDLVQMCHELKGSIPQIQKRIPAEYNSTCDNLDLIAQEEIPLDGPVMLRAIKTIGDGNCLCRALSRAYFNTDERHIEIRARIVIEGVVNMDKYLNDDCLERGATLLHENADLPTVFATFSEYYTPGQKVTEDTIQYIYSMEIYSCARLGAYMGIWQLAQSSTVLGVPLHTIYPHRGESSLRNDFHRIFFPVMYPTVADDEPIVIMWTGMRRGSIPSHFVPLLKKPE